MSRTTTHDIILLADLHIGGDHAEAAHANRLAASIAQTVDPARALIVVCGDCTQDGAPDQVSAFDGWCEWLEERGYSVAVVPGNHDVARGGFLGVEADIRARFILGAVKPRLAVQGGAHDVWYTDHGDLRVILLDSTQGLIGWGITADLARGKIGEAALRQAGVYAEQHGGPVALALHHHPTYRTHLIPGDNRLIDVDALDAWVVEYDPVFIACGHKHRLEELRMGEDRLCLAGAKSTSVMTYGGIKGYGAWWVRRAGGEQHHEPFLF